VLIAEQVREAGIAGQPGRAVGADRRHVADEDRAYILHAGRVGERDELEVNALGEADERGGRAFLAGDGDDVRRPQAHERFGLHVAVGADGGHIELLLEDHLVRIIDADDRFQVAHVGDHLGERGRQGDDAGGGERGVVGLGRRAGGVGLAAAGDQRQQKCKGEGEKPWEVAGHGIGSSNRRERRVRERGPARSQ